MLGWLFTKSRISTSPFKVRKDLAQQRYNNLDRIWQGAKQHQGATQTANNLAAKQNDITGLKGDRSDRGKQNWPLN